MNNHSSIKTARNTRRWLQRCVRRHLVQVGRVLRPTDSVTHIFKSVANFERLRLKCLNALLQCRCLYLEVGVFFLKLRVRWLVFVHNLVVWYSMPPNDPKMSHSRGTGAGSQPKESNDSNE